MTAFRDFLVLDPPFFFLNFALSSHFFSPLLASTASSFGNACDRAPYRSPAIRPAIELALRSGGGTRLKILEAWCARTPVVSTTIGAEGLGATSGQDILLADSPQEFVKAVLHACTHDEVSANARLRFEHEFSHEAGWQKLDEAGVFSV